MTRKTKTTSALAAIVGALIATALVAGCGNAASPSESASTIYPQTSATGTVPALKAYLGDAGVILGQVATTVGSLPSAVGDLSTKPDNTWTASAAQLRSIASQLGDEADALAALQPPSALQPVQDAVVKGIRSAQAGVEKLATQLDSRAQTAATRPAQVKSTVDQLRTQIEGLAKQLKDALGRLPGQ